MLIQFKFSNFRSFRDDAELSFVGATNLKHPPGFGATAPEGYGKSLLHVLGLFGANASGKTNVARAMWFMKDAVARSHRLWPPEGPIPVQPFRLDAGSAGQPSRFQLDLIVDRVPMQYGFALTSEEVREEWLLAWPGGRQQQLFERTGAATFRFGRGLKGPNETIRQLTRGNSLFLSAAAQNNHEQLKPLYREIVQKILPLSPDDELQRRMFTMVEVNQGRKADIMRLVQLADLGIVGLDVEEDAEPEGDVPTRRLTFSHATKEAPGGVSFDESEESRGTLAWFALVGPVLRALADGSTLVADELDTSLHEVLQAKVIQLFNDPRCNPRGAQLLFTSQDTTVLGDALGRGEQDGEALLRRDQIWFAEKGQDGSSTLVPLTDFHVRKHENIQRWYLRGRFGAVPILDERLVPCPGPLPAALGDRG
jgi:hypothetical protein